jgi:hypothetical protein
MTFTESTLAQTIRQLLPFRDELMSMLRPMDLISLIRASGMPITKAERTKYLALWRQIFFDMQWVAVLKERNCTITVIGNDMRRLHTALARGDSALDTSTLKIVVVIGETQESRSYQHSRYIIQSFDGTVAWHEIPADAGGSSLKIDQNATEIQVCVLSALRGSCTDLDHTWTSIISQRHGSLAQFLIGTNKPYPSSFDVWESQWQPLEDAGLTMYNPIHMHYIVDPSELEKYTTRIFVNSKLASCAIMVKPMGLIGRNDSRRGIRS